MSWQCRLFDRLLVGNIPTALDLPTGLGKTSVIAIWLAARAFADDDVRKKIPRRLVYVVDRRVVVDQATAVAETLRDALNCDVTQNSKAIHLKGLSPDEQERAFAALQGLKERLGFAEKKCLPISTLRGAHADNREWLADPGAPAIVVGTVDMIGSRLLFEGYGVSRKMRPYHAGVLGADALVVLDEAHLVPPFEAVLRQISDGAREFGPCFGEYAEIVPACRLLSLSATGRMPESVHAKATEEFRLEGGDLSNKNVAERLAASKTLECCEIDDGKDALVETLARRAWALSQNGGNPIRGLVYCDSREVAEKVKTRLDQLAMSDKKAENPKADTALLVGSRRVKEREDVAKWLQDHGFIAGTASLAKPVFLIATSAGEVGIDLDADHMVCDLVPWERMVQRLGRVNRRGEGKAAIVVVHGGEPKPKKADAPTDRERLQAIGFCSLVVLNALPDAGGGKDASPGALRDLKLQAESDAALKGKITAATTPEPLHPALTRALVDAWSMTSLEKHTGRPEIAPWLRGWVEEDPQTAVVWRQYLPLRLGEDRLASFAGEKETDVFFDAAPPHESEKLETESYRVAAWLQERAQFLLKRALRTADTQTADEGDVVASKPLLSGDVVLFVLLPDGSYSAHYKLGELAKADKSKEKDDLLKALAGRVLVVNARFGGLKDGMLYGEADEDFPVADTTDSWSQEAGFRVGTERSNDDVWRFETEFVRRRDENGDATEKLVVEHYRSAAQNEEARSVSRPQTLTDHQNLVEGKAWRIAEKVGLSGDAAEALAVAAALHDEGKKAPQWQRAFRAPREKDETGAPKFFAKTRGPINQKLLDGYRHEFGSLPYVEAHDRFKALSQEWQDLVLHLIAAHHGGARPVIGISGGEDAPTALETRAREVALRFAQLQKRWGPWGLAWWEALLRAADQQASRENEVKC